MPRFVTKRADVEPQSKLGKFFAAALGLNDPQGAAYDLAGPLGTGAVAGRVASKVRPLERARQMMPTLQRKGSGWIDALKKSRVLQPARTKHIVSGQPQAGEQAAFKALQDMGFMKKSIDFDLTHSTGGMFDVLDQPLPKHKFDLTPSSPGVVKADVRKGVPLESGSQKTGLFDPPFMVDKGQAARPELMERFGAFDSIDEAIKTWSGGMQEASRIMEPGGELLVKIQDTFPFRSSKYPKVQATQIIQEFARANGMELVGKVGKEVPTGFKSKSPKIVNYMVFKKVAQ